MIETSNGFRLGRDWLYDEKINTEKPSKTVDKLVTKVFDDLEEELEHGGCVDEFMQDQLVVFQALSKGRSRVLGRADASLHTQTARWVASKIVGVEFDDSGGCEGIGFKASQRLFDKAKLSTDVVEELSGLSIEE